MTLPSWTSLLSPTPSIPLDCHRAPVWAPWVVQQIPTGYLFYIRQSTCFHAPLHSSLPLLFSPCVHKSAFLLYKACRNPVSKCPALLSLPSCVHFTQPTFVCSQPLILHFYNREVLSMTLLGWTLCVLWSSFVILSSQDLFTISIHSSFPLSSPLLSSVPFSSPFLFPLFQFFPLTSHLLSFFLSVSHMHIYIYIWIHVCVYIHTHVCILGHTSI